MADKGKDKAKPAAVVALQPQALPKPAETLRSVTALVETSVKQKETRLVAGRGMRMLATVRPHLTPSLLRAYVTGTLASDVGSRPFLLSIIDQV